MRMCFLGSNLDFLQPFSRTYHLIAGEIDPLVSWFHQQIPGPHIYGPLISSWLARPPVAFETAWNGTIVGTFGFILLLNGSYQTFFETPRPSFFSFHTRRFRRKWRAWWGVVVESKFWSREWRLSLQVFSCPSTYHLLYLSLCFDIMLLKVSV